MAPTSKPKVAIIGGGIAGLSCAQQLGSSSYEVTVYDTGRLRPGGRSSSRQPGDAHVPKEKDPDSELYPILSNYRLDHAAQLISVPDIDIDNNPKSASSFQGQVQTWMDQGVLREFPDDSVCQIQKDDKDGTANTCNVRPLKSKFYYGTHGMGGLAMNMLEDRSFQVEQDVWVSPSSGVRYQKDTKKWKVQAKGQTLGYYDKLIIAHNGKCADRIMSKTPAKDVHALLRVNFAPTVPAHGGKKMTLNSIYSLTIALPKDSELSQALKEPFVSGFVKNHPNLRMITCQTRKYPNPDPNNKNNNSHAHEVWTVLSSAKFAKKYKAPQESLPDDVIEEVTGLLLEAVEESILGKPVGLTPLDKRLQLWGAAVPLNVWTSNDNDTGFIYDAEHSVGVCGDWLVEPSIAGAWTSGRLLAQHLLDDPSTTAGLEGQFEINESASKLGIASLKQ
jgi:predicted NAD/FAD-dependent oxidoreductase